MNPNPLRHLAFGFSALTLLALPALAGHNSDSSTSYIRIVEGDVELAARGENVPDSAEANQPILAGDRLSTAPRASRAEVVLADFSALRIDRSTELLFHDLGEEDGRTTGGTRLELLTGTVQLSREEDGSELRLDTANATFYLSAAGSYLFEAEASGYSALTVRRGNAEAVTQRGSLVVRDGETAVIDGSRYPRATIEDAGQLTALERWGRELDDEARLADLDDLDRPLRYGAASLRRHGTWIEVGHRRAWRPYVDAGWRPYQHGRWVLTPRGLTWVSSEPWGWTPYHYGSWDYTPGYGWVWYPGSVYSPAWVYWYWSADYVGWCPTGYYANYYSSRHHRGFRHGVYGTAHGDWGFYGEWNFLPTHRLRDRHQARWVRPSYALREELGGARLGRGIITTDTGGLTREVLDKPEEALRVVRTRPNSGGREELPDVTPFIARQDLPPEVERRIVEVKEPEGPRGTPDRPAVVREGEKPRVATRPGRQDGPVVVEAKPTEGVREAPPSWREREVKPQDAEPRIERRPARPVVLPQGKEPEVESNPAPIVRERPVVVRRTEDKPAETDTPPATPRVERKPAETYTPPARVERRPAPASPPPPATVRAAPKEPVEVRPASPPPPAVKPSSEPKRESGSSRQRPVEVKPEVKEEKPPAG